MDVAMVSSWCVYLKEDPIGPTACQDRCRIEIFIIINLTRPSTCTTFYYILLHFTTFYYILLHFTTFLEVLVARFPYSHTPFIGHAWFHVFFWQVPQVPAEVALLAVVALAQNHLSAVSEEWPCSGAHQCPGPSGGIDHDHDRKNTTFFRLTYAIWINKYM